MLAMLVAAVPLLAPSLRVEAVAVRPPAALHPAIRDALDPAAISLADEEGAIAEFWIRRPLPTRPASPRGLRVRYTELEPGVLVGAVRFARSWTDARGRPIPAGVYTLRYAIQPLLKEHSGVSEFRDFLLVAPAAYDAGLEVLPDEAIQQSRPGADSPHPRVLALVPVEAGGPPPPALLSSPSGLASLVARVGDLVLGIAIGPAENIDAN